MAASLSKVVVTGASGHIGFHVARVLLDHGLKVVLLLRSVNENVVDLESRGASVHLCDFGDAATFGSALAGAECLFHLAADNSTKQDPGVRAGTFDLTRQVLTEAVARKVSCIVYTSSVVALGRSDRPDRLISEADTATTFESPYVRGKAEAETWCDGLIAGSGVDIRRVYPSWVVGPDDAKFTPPHRAIAQFLEKPRRFVPPGGISVTGVEAVARAHVAAWLQGAARGRYVLGGTNVTFLDFFRTLAKFAEVPPPSLVLPKAIIVAGADVLTPIGNAIGKTLSPIDPAYARSVVGRYSWYDSTQAQQALGYRIPDLAGLLEQAVTDMRRRVAGTRLLGRPRVRGPAESSSGLPLLITGVPGWLGNRFIEALISGLRPDSPVPMLRQPSSRKVRLLVEPRFVRLLDLPQQFEIVPGALGDARALRQALMGVATVYHLAGAVTPKRTRTFHEVNAEGTRLLVDQCILAGVRRFLLMSTDAIAGHGTAAQRIFDEHTADAPYGEYGRSKSAAERYLLARTAEGKIDGTSIRGFWFFGPHAPPRQRRFLAMAGRGRSLIVGRGDNFRSISVTDNVVAAFLLAEGEARSIGKWYWIGDKRADYTVAEIGSILAAAAGAAERPIRLPAAVGGLARAVDAVLARAGLVSPAIHTISKFDFDIAGDISAARRDFGYEPVTSLADYAQAAFGRQNNRPGHV